MLVGPCAAKCDVGVPPSVGRRFDGRGRVERDDRALSDLDSVEALVGLQDGDESVVRRLVGQVDGLTLGLEEHVGLEILGAGVALIDYDQDGDLDFYLLTNEYMWPNGSQPPDPRKMMDSPPLTLGDIVTPMVVIHADRWIRPSTHGLLFRYQGLSHIRVRRDGGGKPADDFSLQQVATFVLINTQAVFFGTAFQYLVGPDAGVEDGVGT